MKSLLWFLFSFNLLVAVAAGLVLDGPQQIATCAGMGVVSIGAAAGLVLGRTKVAR